MVTLCIIQIVINNKNKVIITTSAFIINSIYISTGSGPGKQSSGNPINRYLFIENIKALGNNPQINITIISIT